jgi:hypothetical protein
MLLRELDCNAFANSANVSVRREYNNRHRSTIKSTEPHIYVSVVVAKADNLKLPRSPCTRARRDIVARRGG